MHKNIINIKRYIIYKLYIAIFFLLFVSACGEELRDLSMLEEEMKAQGTKSSYLALEYLDFARSLTDQDRWFTAQYFAKKGLKVSQKENVVPEDPTKWDVDKSQLQELISAQKRLESLSSLDAILPTQVAHLTFLYDCVVVKESMPAHRLGELSKCKTRFYKLLDEMENYLSSMKKDGVKPTEIKEPEFERFEILFDLNSSKFNENANKKIVEIIKHLMKLNGNYYILLVGNADRLGLELYNEALAFKRVDIVKNYLEKNGVLKNLISIRSFGEDFPDIITKKGIQEQLNRSVAIYVLIGVSSNDEYPLPLIMNYIYKKEMDLKRRERGLE
jgi:outer membrane protein OmpA-like peptidoglycan-associated protein